MLQTLMSQPARVHSRDNLMKFSYPDERIVSNRTIDSHIKNLRKKLSEVVDDNEIIHSIYGVGYNPVTSRASVDSGHSDAPHQLDFTCFWVIQWSEPDRISPRNDCCFEEAVWSLSGKN